MKVFETVLRLREEVRREYIENKPILSVENGAAIG
jgi:hypothetical protein